MVLFLLKKKNGLKREESFLLRQKPVAGYNKIIVRALAFILPAGLLLAALVQLGVYPFGAKSLLVVDMNSEYIDYFMQLNKIAREQGSFLRSWDMGMGLNMLGLIAFYAASPLNIILLLTPAGALTEGVLAVTVLKFGLCGLFFSIYVSYTFKRDDAVGLACCVAYALCGYNIAYSSNIMWLDGVCLLPLVLTGVEKLLREDRCAQYIAALAVVFFSGYYIGYMLGIFTFLYFTARFFTEKNGLRDYLRKLARFLTGAALAAGCCMALLLPAFLNLRNGQNTMFTVPMDALALRHSFIKLGAKLLPGVYDSLTDSGLPNIFVTTAVTLLVVLFFLNRLVPLREKLIFGSLAGFMLLSFSWGILDIAWHAFEVPTWFPARYSFVMCFLLIHMALRGLERPAGLTTPRVLAGIGILIFIIIEIAVARYKFVPMSSVVLGILLAAVYGLSALALTIRSRSRSALLALGLVLVCAEAWYGASEQLAGIDKQFSYRDRDSYYAYRERFLPAVEQVEREYPGVYRIEVDELRNANGGMALAYKGISHYSSTGDQTLNALLRKLGYNTGTINEIRFARNTPLTNGLLGIRYVLSRDGLGPGYLYAGREGSVKVFQNEAAFPLAFFADSQALSVDLTQPDPFLLQNEWVRSLLPEHDLPELFLPLDVEDEDMQNLMPEELENGAMRYIRPLSDIPGSFSLIAHNPYGMSAYAFFPVYKRQFAAAEAFVNGAGRGRELSYRSNTVLELGDGEYPRVRLELTGGPAGIQARHLYALDIETAVKAALLAERQAMEFTRFEGTRLGGAVTAPRDGILATSIPYDSGWTVRVDGKKAELQKLMGVFLAVELTQGVHQIDMRYTPPGFVVGSCVSVICVAGTVLWLSFRASRKVRGRSFFLGRKI